MTKLETILSDTFRLARWVNPAGEYCGPQCGDCYDDAHVEEDRAKNQRRSFAGAKVYLCKACCTRFTDRTGTPLSHSHFGYRRWAAALLVPAVYAETRWPKDYCGIGKCELTRLRAKLATAPALTLRWKAKIDEAGITFEQIQQEEARAQAAKRKTA